METAPDRLESAVISRLMWRLMPFLFLLYIVAYLDRINVSFAVLQMRGQLGLSDRVYGRAAGMFFAGYFFFQLPSNLVLEKFGVRRWISGLMITWGVISCLMIFIRGPISFYGMRFLLGAAEAGFFPGMILYMKRWFPANARARAVAWFMMANPIAGIVGSPVSGALLGISGQGLSGWQWMFLMEGIPAILLGAAVFWALADNPREAHWLKGEERVWLLERLALEQEAEASLKKENLWSVLISPQNLDAVDGLFWRPHHHVRSYFVAPKRDPIVVGTQLFYDGTGVCASVSGNSHRNGFCRHALRSQRRAPLAYGRPCLCWGRCHRSGGLRGFRSLSGGMHRPWHGLCGVDGRAFLGYGNYAHGRAFCGRGDCSHQLSGESGWVFRSRHYWIFS